MRKATLKNILVFFYGITITLLILPFYVDGDQRHYREFYENISNLGLLEAFDYYTNTLGTKEPGYFILIYLCEPFVSKDVLMSVLNGVLSFLLARFFVRQKTSLIVIFLLLCNYYLFVLFFAAERLKLALLLYFLAYESTKGRGGFIFVAVMSHVQTLLLIFIRIFEKSTSDIFSVLRGKSKDFRSTIFVLIGIFLMLYLLRDHILDKQAAYSAMRGGQNSFSGGLFSTVKPLIFTVFSYICSRAKYQALLLQTPLVVAAFFLGDERVAIFSYFVFMYYGLQLRRGLNFFVISTAMYFAYNGLLFATTIIRFGNGYHVI